MESSTQQGNRKRTPRLFKALGFQINNFGSWITKYIEVVNASISHSAENFHSQKSFSYKQLSIPACLLTYLIFTLSNLSANTQLSIEKASVPDDAYYYLEIAKRFSEGQFSTFDGLNVTTGYQILWAILLIPIVRYLPLQNVMSFVLNLQIVLLSIALVIMWRFIQEIPSRNRLENSKFKSLLSLVPFILFPITPTASKMINGLETCLSILLLTSALRCYQLLLLRPSKTKSLFLAAILALLILARSDNILFVGLLTILVAMTARVKLNVGVKYVLTIPWVTYLLQVTLNFLLVGTPTQVSGAVKIRLGEIWFDQQVDLGVSKIKLIINNFFWPLSNFQSQSMDINSLSFFSVLAQWPMYHLLEIGLLALLTLLVLRQSTFLALVGFVLLAKHAVYSITLFTPIYPWYWSQDSIYILLITSFLLTTYSWRRLIAVIWCIAVCAIGYFEVVPFWSANRNYRPPWTDLAEYKRIAEVLNASNMPKDQALSAHNAGVLGFYSKMSIVNLDGLVNGKKLYGIISREGPNFVRYLSEEPRISGYVDLFDDSRAKQFDAAFQSLGFFEVTLFNECLREFTDTEGVDWGKPHLWLKAEYLRTWECPNMKSPN